jgi:hypothetical protein
MNKFIFYGDKKIEVKSLDKEKIISFMSKLTSILLPAVKSEKAKEITSFIAVSLVNIINETNKRLKEMIEE